MKNIKNHIFEDIHKNNFSCVTNIIDYSYDHLDFICNKKMANDMGWLNEINFTDLEDGKVSILIDKANFDWDYPSNRSKRYDVSVSNIENMIIILNRNEKLKQLGL